MKKKKRTSGKGTGINIGDISDISGTVSIAGRDMITHQTTTGLSTADIKRLFEQVYTVVESRANTSSADKEDLKADIKEVQTVVTEAAQKSEKLPEEILSRRFRNLARMAPDVLDEVVGAMGHPALGVGAAVKKMADKAKEETKRG